MATGASALDAEPEDDEAAFSNAASFTAVGEPGLQRLAVYWAGRCAGRRMPRRQDIDPLDIPWALSQIFVVERVSAPQEWRYRLAGEEIERAFGKRSLRGLGLDDMLSPEMARRVRARWKPLAERGCAVYMHGLIYKAADRYAYGGRLLLPLADGADDKVTGLIGMTEVTEPHTSEPPSGPSLEVVYIDLPE